MTRDKMSPTTASLDVLRPLLGNDIHPTHPITSRRGGAVAADAQQCGIAPAGPSRKLASSTLSAYHRESAAYTGHPARPCHARASHN